MCRVNRINDICAANKLRCIVCLPIPAPSHPLCHSNALGTDFLFNSLLSCPGPGSPLPFPSLFLFRVYYTTPDLTTVLTPVPSPQVFAGAVAAAFFALAPLPLASVLT